MKSLPVTRLLPWLLLTLSPAVLNHCGGATEHGTETGNPPVVEQQKLHIVLHDDGVEVVGDPGAVSPGATVSVTNRNTGDHAEAIARADGSVSVSVPGSLQDTYDVTVSNRGGTQTVQVMSDRSDGAGGLGGANGTGGSSNAGGSAGSSNAGGTAGSAGGSGAASTELSDTDLPSASCDALENALGQRVSTAYSSANSACRTDDDCVYVNWGAACYYQCGSSFLSTFGATSAQEQALQDTAPVCNELESRCLRQPPSSCPPGTTTTPECSNGVCQGLELGNYSCDQLSNSASARLNGLLENAQRGCTQDSDCVLYDPSLACVADCGRITAVTAVALPELTGSVQRLERRFCSEFENRSCTGPFALPCPAPRGAASVSCQAEQCTLSFASPF